MRQVTVRSRFVNLLLAVYGAAYVLGTLYVLVWYVVDVASAASLADRAMQFILVLGIGCGVWFINVALYNLGLWRGGLPHFARRASGSVQRVSLR